MKTTVFFSQDAPSILVGPGNAEGPDVVRFTDGYYSLERDDPRYDEKVGWIRSVRQYRIEELGDADDGRVVSTEDNPYQCSRCSETGDVKAFKSRQSLNGHLMSHRPR